jgi:hypothetical protein
MTSKTRLEGQRTHAPVTHSVCCLAGLALCGLSACYLDVNTREASVATERCESENESPPYAADGAHVSLKLALASRDEQQLCKLVLAERGIRLTWAEGLYKKRAHHGLRALRGCAVLLRQAVAAAGNRSSSADT